MKEKKSKKFSNTHQYYNYLRDTNDADLTKEEKRDKKNLYKTLDKIFMRGNEPHKHHVLTADGRKRLSTMIKPELKLKVQTYAAQKGYSIADVIELALQEYLDGKNITS